MSRFFTADLHLGHTNIISHCKRPYKDRDHMAEELIRLWNEVVPKNGEVFILGDFFSFADDMVQVTDITTRMHGKKILIFGNHDCQKLGKPNKITKFIIDNGLVDEASHYKEINIAGHLTVLSHYPFERWNKAGYGSWNLHGHVHGHGRPQKGRLDVGVDAHNYKPWTEDEIIEFFQNQK